MKEMDPEDYAVYEKIEQSRDKGITAIDLKNKLSPYGFTSTTLTKVLKRLDKKGFIKKLKSLEQKHRQVYMTFEMEPSSEVTGGLVTHDSFDLNSIEIV